MEPGAFQSFLKKLKAVCVLCKRAVWINAASKAVPNIQAVLCNGTGVLCMTP